MEPNVQDALLWPNQFANIQHAFGLDEKPRQDSSHLHHYHQDHAPNCRIATRLIHAALFPFVIPWHTNMYVPVRYFQPANEK